MTSDVISVKNSFSYKVSANEIILMKYLNFNEHVKIPQLTKFCAKFFWLILFNTENKRRNGSSQDIIFVLLNGLILKTCLCCHLCPKIGLNYPSGWFISLKSEETKTLGLKQNLGVDKLDNGVIGGRKRS